jgi:hypothetical protein
MGRAPVEGRVVGTRTVTVNFGKGAGVVHKLDVEVDGAVRGLDVLRPEIFAQVGEGERVRVWIALNTVVQVELLDHSLPQQRVPGRITPKQWEMQQRRLRQKP